MRKLLLLKITALFIIFIYITSFSYFLSSVQAISILNDSKQDSPNQPGTKLVFNLELNQVGDVEVAPGMIFLETKEAKPTFRGTAAENSSVVIEIGNKTETVKSNSNGKWEWIPSEDLANGESELKITNGDETKTYRLKVILIANPVSTPSPSLLTTPLPSFQTDTKNQAPGLFSSLQGFLPFIIGGLAVGILLFLISRLLKPKNTILSEIETPTPPPDTPTSNPVPGGAEILPSTSPWNPSGAVSTPPPAPPVENNTPFEPAFPPQSPTPPPRVPVNPPPLSPLENPPENTNSAIPPQSQSASPTNPIPPAPNEPNPQK